MPEDEKNEVEIEFITLDCGHSVVADFGMGQCSECKATCCGRCLQVIDSHRLCPKCFAGFVRDKDVEDA